MIRLEEATGWAGWTLGPYGKAREWRLFAPDGTHYTAQEVSGLRGMVLDLDFLRGQVRELREKVDGSAVHFSADDLLALRLAVAVLDKIAPAERRRVDLPNVPRALSNRASRKSSLPRSAPATSPGSSLPASPRKAR